MSTSEPSATALEYRAAYDAQLRARIPDGFSRHATVERVGPLLRKTYRHGEAGFLDYRDLGGLDGPELDALITGERDHFAGLNTAVEWKYHGHDLPPGLPGRLTAAGFVPDESETVLVGEAAALAGEPRPPEGVTLREVTSRADFERIRAMEEEIWGVSHDWLPDMLESEAAGPGDPCVVVVAESGDTVVCAGWARFHQGTDFVSLWGGSTLPQWRGRGVYRATVAHRARLAVAAGHRFVEVDASADSAPVLRRLGLVAVTTTVPYVWSPDAGTATGPGPA
ncbi:GNAT family N-acetyltransferase [Streptomyces sp. NPDC002574]|uniref:GNAT family N-acetyltransferase n=1 Tax=Streptomyces sp. NPDC002574 TaxID=3364652 RepID=UPI0036A5CF69